jgi:hypothetical protein
MKRDKMTRFTRYPSAVLAAWPILVRLSPHLAPNKNCDPAYQQYQPEKKGGYYGKSELALKLFLGRHYKPTFPR